MCIRDRPYTINDPDGETSSAIHTVEVPNAPPVAVDETVTTQPDTPVVIDPLANEIAPNGESLAITEVAGVPITPGVPQTIAVPNGTVTVDADGTITVTPDAGFAGDIDIPYTIVDENGVTDTAVHTVEVAGAPPVVPDPGTPPIDPVPIGAANIDLLTVVPTGPRQVITANSISEREFDRQELELEPVLLDAIENLDSLHRVDLASLVNLDLQNLDVSEALSIEFIPDVVYKGSEGYSSGKGYRGTHSIDPTDECGRFFIDTISRDNMLSVIARSTIDPDKSSGVIGFTATLANGQPQPDWISEVADGEYMVDRSVDIPTIALKLVAHRENGDDFTRIVEIDTFTGLITEPGADISQAQNNEIPVADIATDDLDQ